MTVGGTVKGLAVINFSEQSGRGTRAEEALLKASIPGARIMNVVTRREVPAYSEEGKGTLNFRSFAYVEADSEDDLRRIGEYIHEHFSHVEVYGFDFGG